MSPYLPDILVLCTYFALIMGIGLSQRSKSGKVEGFTLGDRQIPWWAVLASILAAEISAATFLGAPGEGYEKRNWTYAQLAIGTVLARILVSVIFIPIYYKLGVISIYEYLETRFGNATRKFASATFLVTRVLAMGTRLYVSAIIIVLAFELFWGRPATPIEEFWFFACAIILVTVLTAVYTAVGGIRAVIWTDFIQVGVLLSALGFSIWFLLGKIPGGWETVSATIRPPVFIDTLPRTDSESLTGWFARMFTQEYTIYAAIIASTFVTMATHGIDQDTVQRMLTAKSKAQSMLATIASGLVDLPVVGAFILIGVLLGTYYATGAPADLPTEGREVFPFFILHVMPPGLRGLVTAGIMATAMGSLSTALNALATSFSSDFVFRGRENELTDTQRVRILRFSTAGFALLIILVGVSTAYYSSMHPGIRIIPLVLGILGFTFGSLLGVFLLAVFTRRGNDVGNIVGMCCGFAAVMLLSNVLGIQQVLGFEKSYVIAFPWRITLGTIVTFLVAVCFPPHVNLQSPPAKSTSSAS